MQITSLISEPAQADMVYLHGKGSARQEGWRTESIVAPFTIRETGTQKPFQLILWRLMYEGRFYSKYYGKLSSWSSIDQVTLDKSSVLLNICLLVYKMCVYWGWERGVDSQVRYSNSLNLVIFMCKKWTNHIYIIWLLWDLNKIMNVKVLCKLWNALHSSFHILFIAILQNEVNIS